MKQITKAKAKTMIQNFVSKNKGKSVLFNSLNETDKKAYILTKSFLYFNKFLKSDDALTRALNNMEAHAKDNFKVYVNKINEHLIISE